MAPMVLLWPKRGKATAHDLKDASFVFDGGIRSLIEDAAHVAITLW